MYDRNITIYMQPGSNIWRQEMLKLPFPYSELAEKMYIPSSYDELTNITSYKLLEKESYFQCRPLKWPTLTYPFPLPKLQNITGITCLYEWHLDLGKRSRSNLLQIQGNNSHRSSFCGRRIPQQQEMASEWGKYKYTHIWKHFCPEILRTVCSWAFLTSEVCKV